MTELKGSRVINWNTVMDETHVNPQLFLDPRLTVDPAETNPYLLFSILASKVIEDYNQACKDAGRNPLTLDLCMILATDSPHAPVRKAALEKMYFHGWKVDSKNIPEDSYHVADLAGLVTPDSHYGEETKLVWGQNGIEEPRRTTIVSMAANDLLRMANEDPDAGVRGQAALTYVDLVRFAHHQRVGIKDPVKSLNAWQNFCATVDQETNPNAKGKKLKALMILGTDISTTPAAPIEQMTEDWDRRVRDFFSLDINALPAIQLITDVLTSRYHGFITLTFNSRYPFSLDSLSMVVRNAHPTIKNEAVRRAEEVLRRVILHPDQSRLEYDRRDQLLKQVLDAFLTSAP